MLIGLPAPPPRFPTLAHALSAAASHPSGVTFVDAAEGEAHLPWREVAARAERAAAAYAARGLRPGDRVAIVLRTEPAFLDAFLGAWRAGAVPVPLYPPVRLGRLEEWVEATARMVRVSGARLVVSGGGARRLLGGVVERAAPPLGLLDAGALAAGTARLALEPSPADLGLVQFSSGSTVDPKPVALSHRALAAHAASLAAALSPGPDDLLVSWLPLYHDMGLIGCLLGAMGYPGPLVLIPPEAFLARPELWLRALARHRATITAGPSFAFAYCADRVPDAALRGRSLAPLRFVLDGAEPVSGEALRRFAGRFERFGLRPGALLPVYGLSEAALAVTFSRPGDALHGTRLDAARLARDGRVAPGDREVMPVGTPIPGVSVEVRDASRRPLLDDRLGRIWVRGPSLMEGYLGDEGATRRALVDGWLDTGDLGFVHGGRLHVHGRARDLVIVRGANHPPEEFEAALAGLRGLRPGGVAALGWEPPEGGEALLVLAERARGTARRGDAALAASARRAVLERTGVEPRRVEILEPGTLPRTSSGKLRRGEALRRFVAGTLAPPRTATAARLAVAVAAARSGLALARARRRRRA